MLKVPSWIGIGCVKCGTSWTWRELKSHPEIFTPNAKEIHYFSTGSTHDLRWYSKWFTPAMPGQKIGEFTPDYFHHYEAMHRIKEQFPEAKLITLFRHPIERAFSNWKHAVQEKRLSPKKTFDQSFGFWRVRERSIYSRWLKKWWSLFPKEQLKIMWYDDLEKEPVKFIQEIYRFLGVDDTFISPNLEKPFKFHYHSNETLQEAVLSPLVRKKWLEYYEPHTTELEKLTGRDLSAWKV
jgi:hypothetical protein